MEFRAVGGGRGRETMQNETAIRICTWAGRAYRLLSLHLTLVAQGLGLRICSETDDRTMPIAEAGQHVHAPYLEIGWGLLATLSSRVGNL